MANIEKPRKKGGRIPKDYPWDTIEVDDSFYFADYTRLNSINCSTQCNRQGVKLKKKFSSRKLDIHEPEQEPKSVIHVWRDK